MTGHVLVVDDDDGLRRVLCALLEQGGFQTSSAAGGAAALAALEGRDVDVILTDQRMPQMDGLTLLGHVKGRWPDLPVVFLTAHGSVALAVEAMKAGAQDFVQKPVDRDELLFTIGKAMKIATHRAAAPEAAGSPGAMAEVRRRIDKAARGEATVLIRGESGTGKSVTARAIHEASPRAGGPFVVVQCGALPDSLLQSELFGHEKGAFTGATTKKLGRVAVAEGGTLFLDEIGDVSPAMQLELLGLVQTREYHPVGGATPRRADVRLVAATHRDLEGLVARGAFREDLYYRLDVVPIVIPPLRARRGEIPALARTFCAAHAAANRRPDAHLSDEAVSLLTAEPWPGNVRQLENFVERLVVLSEAPRITAVQVRRELGRVARAAAPDAGAAPPDGAGALDARRRETEQEALREALERAGNNRSQAARLLGISRRTLYNKLHAYGLL